MCGIVGILDCRRPVDPAELDRFTDTLSHRGPDGRGTMVDGPIGLGHRRLAILDLSEAGRNPMPYGGDDGRRYWITYNGEVYNFPELRRELEGLGRRFRSDGDTEVIVAAYAQWGEACLTRFNGMWAFAVWDSVERRLFLARDRFGVKPLYYVVGDGWFCFASELKAFLALDRFAPAVNDAMVPGVLGNSYAYEGSSVETIMRGVRRLPGGSLMTVNTLGEGSIRSWWDTRAHIPVVPERYEEQVEQFREIFMDAVRIRLRSDVPVGSSLSGGVDSGAVVSAIAALRRDGASDLTRAPVGDATAFVMTFPGTMIDERQYAEAVVAHTGTAVRYGVFDPDRAATQVTASVWAMEDVYGGVAVPVLENYRVLRENNVVVSLDGHGGDEVLGGYAWYLNVAAADLNETLYQDVHRTLLPAILRNYDRCSMAHGIEVRMPLMDWRLVVYAFGLPASSKIGGGYTKRILRDAVAGLMPDPVRLRRQKIGFNSPMIEWFNGALAPLIHDVVNDPVWVESPYWNGPALREFVLGKTRAQAWTQDDWGLSLSVWTRMNFVLWHRLFIEKKKPDLH